MVVPIHFKSLRSSSSGNCLLIWTRRTQILIDCGTIAQYKCEKLLRKHAGRIDSLDAVVVTHAHRDHICHSSLRVFARHGVRIRAHEKVIRQMHQYHGCEDWDEPPDVQPFSDEPFCVGDLRIRAIELPHAPGMPTFGFVIHHGEGAKCRKLVICTDFYDYSDVLDEFVDAHFIFVESNYDAALLRENPNEASRFHMSNLQTASLLFQAITRSERAPQAVMLGHVSRERNRKKLAVEAVEETFDRHNMELKFDLSAAPRLKPSKTIRII